MIDEVSMDPSGLSSTPNERAHLSVFDSNDIVLDAILCDSVEKYCRVKCKRFSRAMTHLSGNMPNVISGKYNDDPLLSATFNKSDPRGAHLSTSAI